MQSNYLLLFLLLSSTVAQLQVCEDDEDCCRSCCAEVYSADDFRLGNCQDRCDSDVQCNGGRSCRIGQAFWEGETATDPNSNTGTDLCCAVDGTEAVLLERPCEDAGEDGFFPTVSPTTSPTISPTISPVAPTVAPSSPTIIPTPEPVETPAPTPPETVPTPVPAQATPPPSPVAEPTPGPSTLNQPTAIPPSLDDSEPGDAPPEGPGTADNTTPSGDDSDQSLLLIGGSIGAVLLVLCVFSFFFLSRRSGKTSDPALEPKSNNRRSLSTGTNATKSLAWWRTLAGRTNSGVTESPIFEGDVPPTPGMHVPGPGISNGEPNAAQNENNQGSHFPDHNASAAERSFVSATLDSRVSVDTFSNLGGSAKPSSGYLKKIASSSHASIFRPSSTYLKKHIETPEEVSEKKLERKDSVSSALSV